MAISIEGLRPAVDDDIVGLNEIYNHYVRTSHATFDLDPTGIDWRREWLSNHSGGRYRAFVAVDGERIVGFAASSRHRPKAAYDTTVETSVYVAPDFLGHGVGTALYRVLLRAIEKEDVHRALAGIAQPNEASIALHKRFGFAFAGHFTQQGRKFDRYWDVDWYERHMDATRRSLVGSGQSTSSEDSSN